MDKKQRRFGLWAGVTILLVVGVLAANRLFFYHPSSGAARADVSALMAGVGNAVTLATTPSDVAQSVSSVAAFVSSRSSVTISSSISSRLQDLETRTLNGQLHRLSPSQVAGAISDSLHERLASVTDAQIDSMASNSFRVWPDARSVSYWSPQVCLRKTGECVKDAPTFVQKAKEYRDSSTAEAILYRSQAPGIIAGRIKKRSSELKTDVSGWSNNNLSPVQSYILAYSLVLDDDLVFSVSQQTNIMQQVEDRLFTAHGVPRSAAGRPPFGANGYLYASPSDIFFDNNTAGTFLNRLEALGQP